MSSDQEILEKLQTLRNELTNRVNAIDDDVHHKTEPVEKDFAEQVTQRENDDVLFAINDGAKQTLRLIDSAITRIKNGSYGICSICGNTIPEKRLAILPYVTTCVACSAKE